MLKFRVDTSEQRRQASQLSDINKAVGTPIYEDAIPYSSTSEETKQFVKTPYSNTQSNSTKGDEISHDIHSDDDTSSNTSAVSNKNRSTVAVTQDNSQEGALAYDNPDQIATRQSPVNGETSINISCNFPDSSRAESPRINGDVADCKTDKELSLIINAGAVSTATNELTIPAHSLFRTSLKFPHSEQELHEAIIGLSYSKNNNNTSKKQWSIPLSDSDDESGRDQGNWPGQRQTVATPMTTCQPTSGTFSLHCEIEEEDPYSMVKSPTLSIKSEEPPLPPPLSTIPKNRPATATTAPELLEDLKDHVQVEQMHPAEDPKKKFTLKPLVNIKKRSVESYTDPYAEIDPLSPEKPPMKEGQSEPRFEFTLSKSRSRLNPTVKSSEDIYAEINKKVPWNFPSSSEEEDDHTIKSRRSRKTKSSRTTEARQECVKSDDEEVPSLPPKIWSSPGLENNITPMANEGQEESRLEDIAGDDITIEYSALEPSQAEREPSLTKDEGENFLHSSGYEETCDNIDNASDSSGLSSRGSSHALTDYEESCPCVEVDQLSLDSSGRKAKRIVETHETHEIVPADNHEDDIVERIIETQTITEKLDDKYALADCSAQDYSKYLENDDEFVSHIFTLGRTIEKGAAKKRSKDFAFVQNPFSIPEPVIETMPLEKKTVKQKITTLVKKKKAKDEEVVYEDVGMPDMECGPRTRGEGVAAVENDYDHMNDTLNIRWREDTDHYDHMNTESPINNATIRRYDDQNAKSEAPEAYYEANSAEHNDFSQHEISDRKREIKTEKRSLLKGIKKFLKKKDKAIDTCKADHSVLDDDYQEFVP
ncbi:uncharacterized protein [Watersipora subatra]|uniref:uncharacterized protein n=1 Tax=Watersipora subatra TaxID=2589382 RepID=UPI00355BA41C